MIILLIILINLLFYIRTIDYQGICDDIPVFNGPMVIPKSRWMWMYFWYHLQGRKYVSWKLAHWQTLGIHTLNCILIYLAFGRNNFSAIAALLFSINPINNQCSIWISGKGYSQNTTCALLMWIFPYFSIIPYLYGTYFCGASLVLFPLVFLFTKHWWLVSLIILGFLREKNRIFDKTNPGSKYNMESNPELRTIAPRKVIIMFKTIGYYMVNSIFALRLGFYHKYLFLHGVDAESNKKSYKIDKYFFIGIAFVLFTLWTRHIGLLWFCICLSQWMNVISFNQTISNRYVYLPNIGMSIFVASILIHYPILGAMLWVYYVTKLMNFHPFYKNEYWSIEYSCWEQPEFFYPWQNRSVHCFMNGNYHGALGNMIKAEELRPGDWKITYNLTQLYLLLGNIGAAKLHYEKALKCKIDGREEPINKLMERLKKWIDSIEEQAKANNNQVHINIGQFDMQR